MRLRIALLSLTPFAIRSTFDHRFFVDILQAPYTQPRLESTGCGAYHDMYNGLGKLIPVAKQIPATVGAFGTENSGCDGSHVPSIHFSGWPRPI